MSPIMTKILLFTVKTMLSLRYRVRIKGLTKIVEKGDSSILFMPNHPVLIDPVIVMSVLFETFHPVL